MALTIDTTILDEEFRPTQTGTSDDDDVAVGTYDASSFKTAVTALSLNFFTSPTGFPQHAEQQDFVSSTNDPVVTNYFLAKNGSGDAFPTSGTGIPTNLYVGSNQVYLYGTSNSDIVVGRLGTGTTANDSGAVVLVIGVEETKSGGFVTQADMWMSVYAPLVEDGQDAVDSADTLDLANLVYLGSTFDTTTPIPFNNFAGVAPGNNLFNVIFPSDGSTAAQLLLTGSEGETLSTVNVSTTGIGAGSQHIDVGATLRIDTVSGMVKANVDSAPEVNNSDNIDYAARVEIIGADFEITQLNPGAAPERVTITIAAFNTAGAAQEGAYLTDAINSDGTPVTIVSVIILDDDGDDITAAWEANGGVITYNANGTVTISGLNDGANNSHTDGDRVAFTTGGVRFDRFLITNDDPDDTTFDVGNINVTAVQGGIDTEYAELGSKLVFQDDGPLITASTTAGTALESDDTTIGGTDPSGSFTALFNAPDYGADVPASSTVEYSLGISGTGAATNLIETSTNDPIFLFVESGKVVGRSGDDATAAASGPVVFEITVDATGTVTLDQKSAVFHDNTSSDDESTSAMLAVRITLTATVVDSEAAGANDSASVTVDIGNLFLFKDDGPGITAQPGGSGTPNNLEVDNNLGDASDSTDSSSYTLAPGNDGQKSYTIVGPADSSGTYRWTYDDASNTSITGTYQDANNVAQPLYTLVLDPTTGGYTFTMIGTLPDISLDLNPDEVIKAGAPDAPILQIGVLQNDDYVQMTAAGGNINESHGYVGVSNGNLDVGESLTFTLHQSNGALITFEGIQIGTKSAQGGQYSWTAHVAGTSTTISSSSNEVIGKNGTIIIDAADLGGATIDSITIFKVTGPATKIGISDISILVPPDDVQLGFTVELKDGDNDAVTASFVVDIDADNDGDYEASVNSASILPPDPLIASLTTDEQRSLSTVSNTAVLAGAVAAAGLAAMPAAAFEKAAAHDAFDGPLALGVPAAREVALMAIAEHQLADVGTDTGALARSGDLAEQALGQAASPEAPGLSLVRPDETATSPAMLPEGVEAPGGTGGPFVADAVAMPSAEALQALAGALPEQASESAELARVLADALAGSVDSAGGLEELVGALALSDHVAPQAPEQLAAYLDGAFADLGVVHTPLAIETLVLNPDAMPVA